MVHGPAENCAQLDLAYLQPVFEGLDGDRQEMRTKDQAEKHERLCREMLDIVLTRIQKLGFVVIARGRGKPPEEMTGANAPLMDFNEWVQKGC
jgi:hypothetical protein